MLAAGLADTLLALAAKPLYMRVDGDGQRDPGPAGNGAAPRVRQPEDPVPGRPDRARHGPQPALLRGQEPRLLDPSVDRVERLFLPADAVRLRQQSRLDAAGPHAVADRDRLFPDPADGLALPAADPDEAAVDPDPLARRRGARVEHLLGHRDVERRDVPQARLQAAGRCLARRPAARFRPARRVDGALLWNQLFPAARGPDQASRTARKPGVERSAGDASLPAQPALPVQYAQFDLDPGASEANRARERDACAALVVPSLHARQRADGQGDAGAGGRDSEALSRDR